LHAIAAIGHIPPVIGYGQRDSLRFSEPGKITGRIGIPAVHNVASVTGKDYVCQLRCIQLGLITRLAAGFAGLQILSEIGGLSEREERAKTYPDGLDPKTFPQITYHLFTFQTMYPAGNDASF